ncbi:MAG: GGDEF domain-containing protein [Sulfuricurvum sp.]
MGDKNVYDTIMSIHDETISRLRTLHIPPYPVHYKKHFDDIFNERINETLKKSMDENGKAIQNDHTVTRCFDIASDSINAFSETHTNISEAVETQEILIESTLKGDSMFCISMIEELSGVSQKMSNELKKAQEKIKKLNGDLESALSELTTDPLTQITNRKGLSEDLDKVLLAGQQKGLPIVIMMIDADNFKEINDTHGHIAGDKVLYFLAQSMKANIRGGDRVYRYGGEEFLIVLNRCIPEQASVIAEKIRSKIEHSHLIYNGKTIGVTVSIGVTLHHQRDTYDSIIARADDALYLAKEAGKNQTRTIY